MTVHTFVKSMELGKSYTVPSNCTAEGLKDYAESRFGYCLLIMGPTLVRRVCPECRR